MLDSLFLQKWIIGKLPARRRLNPNSWTSFDAVCCLHNGETKDTKGRGGIRIEGELLTYHCFNCQYTASYRPGYRMGHKMRKLLSWFGATDEEVKKLVYIASLIARDYEHRYPQELKHELHLETFAEVEMPEGAKPFSDWLAEANPPSGFLPVLEYTYARGEEIYDAGEFWWTPKAGGIKKFNERVIIPFRNRGRIIGWTARRIDGSATSRYENNPNAQPSLMCNIDALYKPMREYAIIVEGPFDAIALDCVGALGSHLNKEQQAMLKQSGKEIIVLPDKHDSSRPLVRVALENDWGVSFPSWFGYEDIKDAADAVKKLGRLATLHETIKGIKYQELAIRIETKRWLKVEV